MVPAKPPPRWSYRDLEGVIRVNAGHPDLGKYKIEVTSVVEQSRAIHMSRGLNSMPSNYDSEMFSVFHAGRRVCVRDDNRRLINVPGFIVKRKVLLNDKLEFLDG